MPFPTTYTTYVNNVIKILRDYFNLQEYSLRVQFMENPEDRGCRTLMATILVDTRYLDITIRIFPDVYTMYEKGQYDDVARVLVHEFCHTLFQSIWDRFDKYISNAEEEDVCNMFEQQVQRTANIIFQSLPTQFYTPSKPNAKSRKQQSRSSKRK